MTGQFRFSFGAWNIRENADPFGPEVRASIPFNQKLYPCSVKYKRALKKAKSHQLFLSVTRR